MNNNELIVIKENGFTRFFRLLKNIFNKDIKNQGKNISKKDAFLSLYKDVKKGKVDLSKLDESELDDLRVFLEEEILLKQDKLENIEKEINVLSSNLVNA